MPKCRYGARVWLILLGGILLGTGAKGKLGKGVENAGKGKIIMMDHEI